MKNFITAFVLMIAASVTLSARETYQPVQDIEVGNAPVHILYEKEMERFHLFCMGLDEDSDGNYDPGDGDEKPSWWIITEKDGGFDAELERELEFMSLNLMVKPVLDSGDIYIAKNESINRYFWEQEQYWEDEVIDDIHITSMDVHGTDLIVSLAEPDSAGAQLFFITKTTGNKHRYVKIGNTIVSVDKVKLSGGSEKLVLVSTIPGEFSENKMFITDFKTPTIGPDSLVLPENIYQMAVKDSMVYISEYGDNSNIISVNANDMSSQKYYLGTNANPLRPVYNDNALYVPTDDREIRKIDLMTGNMKDIIDDNAYTLEPAFNDNYMVVPNLGYNEDETGNSVTIFKKVYVDDKEKRLDVQVGSQPHAVFKVDEHVTPAYHVICKGIDVDFDGVYDPEDGDEKASWWKAIFDLPLGGIHSQLPYPKEKLRDLPFGSVPYTYGGKFIDQKFYHPYGGHVTVYDDEGEELNKFNIGNDLRVINHFDGKYLLGNRNEEENDVVYIRSMNGETIHDTLNAGHNVIDVAGKELLSGKKAIFVLDEGDFTVPNSSQLFIYKYSALGEYEIDTLKTGDDCIDIEIAENRVYITSNGSNKIIMLTDKNGSFDVQEHYTGTHGWNGPRGVDYDERKDLLYIPTYSGDVRVMTPGGDVNKLYHAPGKVEHLTHSNDHKLSEAPETLIPAVVPLTNTYATNDTLTLFNFQAPNSVIEETDKSLSKIKLYPNPASDMTNLELTGDIKHDISFKIYDLKGNLIRSYDGNIAQSTYSFSLTGLSNGYYVVRIINGSEISTIPLQIQK